MFWIGLVVGIVLTLVVMFELGRYLEKRTEKRSETKEKGGKPKGGEWNERGKGDKRSIEEAKGRALEKGARPR